MVERHGQRKRAEPINIFSQLRSLMPQLVGQSVQAVQYSRQPMAVRRGHQSRRERRLSWIESFFVSAKEDGLQAITARYCVTRLRRYLCSLPPLKQTSWGGSKLFLILYTVL